MNRGADILTGLLHHAASAMELLEAVRTTVAGLSDEDFRGVCAELDAEADTMATTELQAICLGESARRFHTPER